MHCTPLSCRIWVCRGVSHAHELERGCRHQDGAGPRHQSEIRLVPGSSHSRRVRQRPRPVHVRTHRDRRGPTSVAKRRINMPPGETECEAWAVSTPSSGSSIARPEKSVPKPSTTRKRMSCRAISKRMFGPITLFIRDEMRSYDDLPQPHEAVQHSTGEYVRGDVQHSWRIRTALSQSGRCCNAATSASTTGSRSTTWIDT